MLMQPRSYQSKCVESIFRYFQQSKGNPICALPTGTGKSVCIAMFIEQVLRNWPGQRILVLTHVKELVEQNHAKLINVWPHAPAGINSAGLGQRDYRHPVIFAGIGSVAKDFEKFGRVDLIIIDECHLVSPNDETMYQTFIQGLMQVNPLLKVIGFTATAWRLGHGKLIEAHVDSKGNETPSLFTDICFDITGLEAFNRLIAEGFLAPLIPKHTATILNTDGVRMRGGEFAAGQLQLAVNKDEITAAALREAMELGHDRNHWLVFAAGVEHANDVNDMLNEFGVSSVVIHSKMTDDERDAAIADFKAGKYRAAVNNNILTTGFDFPAIDLIIMLRPTQSPVLWVQMLGRGTRPSPQTGKENCLVLDFAGNTRRLGPINDPVIPRRKGKKQGEAPVKLCGQCGVYNHASVRHCVACNNEFHMQVKLQASAATIELVKGDAPVVEVFKVDHITYSEHRKIDRPPIMKVSYYCGLKMFNEFVCVEHTNYAGRKAREWWQQRTAEPMPATTEEALQGAERLAPATHLRIWVNKKYPEILAHCYDGTAFGESAPGGVAPKVDTQPPVNPVQLAEREPDPFLDDIPF